MAEVSSTMRRRQSLASFREYLKSRRRLFVHFRRRPERFTVGKADGIDLAKMTLLCSSL
jgi:hypothetical protein